MVCHPERAQACAQQSGVDYNKLQTCLNDTDKIEGLRTFIDSVSQNVPGFPFVKVSGKKIDATEDGNLKKALCKNGVQSAC